MSVVESRERLLAAAKKLFLTRGYNGATVDSICESAGLTKGSFYHFFASKEELGIAVLEWTLERSGRRLAEGPYVDLVDPVDQALGYLAHIEDCARELWSDGCLLGTFAVELAESNPKLQHAVSTIFHAVSAEMADRVAPLAKQLPDGPESTDLANHLLMLLEGSITLAKAHRDWTIIPKAVRAYRKSLESALAART